LLHVLWMMIVQRAIVVSMQDFFEVLVNWQNGVPSDDEKWTTFYFVVFHTICFYVGHFRRAYLASVFRKKQSSLLIGRFHPPYDND